MINFERVNFVATPFSETMVRPVLIIAKDNYNLSEMKRVYVIPC